MHVSFYIQKFSFSNSVIPVTMPVLCIFACIKKACLINIYKLKALGNQAMYPVFRRSALIFFKRAGVIWQFLYTKKISTDRIAP